MLRVLVAEMIIGRCIRIAVVRGELLGRRRGERLGGHVVLLVLVVLSALSSHFVRLLYALESVQALHETHELVRVLENRVDVVEPPALVLNAVKLENEFTIV